MTPVKISIEEPDWRELERQLAQESSFDRLLEREEEMEARTCGSVPTCPQPSTNGNAQTRWLQKALNRVSSFGVAENGVASVQTRRALRKFQAERGIRPTGNLGPKTRAALIRMSGIPAPRIVSRDDDESLYEVEGLVDNCPADSPFVIRGFTRYSDDIRLLPPDQQNKLAAIAAQIARSRTAASGATPVAQVIVIGHADMDAAREKREPGFLQFVSEKRAAAVALELACRVGGGGVSPSGRGARAMVVPSPRTEAERACNRRVEVILVPASDSLPHLDQDPTAAFLLNTSQQVLKDFYETALQGTSGQYLPPVAEQKAAEIAEKAMPLHKRLTESACPGDGGSKNNNLWNVFLAGFFKDALQGTAQKYPTADEVVSKAYEIAQHSVLVLRQAQHRLDWASAVLPQPMAPDCEIVLGQVPGPANHVLCGTHGHILDTTAKAVIAHDLDEYKKQPRR
jgi:outer membrane protein OmpA-like peptidoglycan-associated protein